MPVAARLQEVNEYYFSQKLREIDVMNKAGKAVLNLGIGSPDLPPHPTVIEALHHAATAPNHHAYQSYKGTPVLRKAIADWYQQWYGVSLQPDSEILPLIGSKEGIMHICMTYLEPGALALVPNPGYPAYATVARISGATVALYNLTEANDWQPDFTELAAALEQRQPGKQALLFVNYPHMPTGTLPKPELFAQLVVFAQANDVLIVHDNPYSFILNDTPSSLLAVPGALEVAIELNSLSKSQNMAGWRVGMLCANATRVEEVLRFKSNMDSGMFLPVQLAAAVALQLDKSWYAQLNDTYRQRRQQVFNLLDVLGCSYNPQQVGMFVWAKVPDTHVDGYSLSDAVLYGSNVFITPGGIFGPAGNGYIRISLCAPAERFAEATRRVQSFLQSTVVV